jgi:hypothetical protein
VRATILACIVVSGCRDRTPAAPPPSPRDLPDLAEIDLHEPIVAVSPTGRAIVTRKDHRLTVWARSGAALGSMTALAADQPGAWIAVSTGGHLLAEVGENDLRVVDVASGELRWSLGQHEALWGPPVFSPDGRTLALPMNTKVTLLDVATGKQRGELSDDDIAASYPFGESGLGLARTMWYSPDGAHLAIRCGGDDESYENHTLFLADVKRKQLVGGVLGHVELVTDAVWLSDGRLVSADAAGTLREIRDGRVQRVLALGQQGYGTFVVSDDLATVARVTEHGLFVWRARQAPAPIALGPADGEIVRLELMPGKVIAMFRAGRVHTYAVPAPVAQPEAAAWTEPDATARAREAALYGLFKTEDNPNPIALDLVEDCVTSGLIHDAHEMLESWLAHPRAAELERAKSLGLALARVEPLDLEKPIIDVLYARWPNDVLVVRTLLDRIIEDDPERAAGIVRRAVARHVLSQAEATKILGP